MPRKFFRRIMPDKEYLQDHRFLRHLGDALHDSNLWHINRHSAATAVFIGLFCAFMPIPFQMLLAAALAIALRGNLPVAVAVVWTSNPVTMAPMLYGAYRIGALLLGTEAQAPVLHLNLEGWLTELAQIWQPLLLGSLICGFAAGSLGYALVKLVWRLTVMRQWHKRQQVRREKYSDKEKKQTWNTTREDHTDNEQTNGKRS